MYVLVGNQGHTALFNGDAKKNKFILEKKFENKKFMKKESDLFSHRAGTAESTYTSDQTTLGESHFKEELVSKYCKSIAKYLMKVNNKKNQESVVVICEPALLGDLKKKIASKAHLQIDVALAKNFYTEKNYELEQFLSTHDLIQTDKLS